MKSYTIGEYNINVGVNSEAYKRLIAYEEKGIKDAIEYESICSLVRNMFKKEVEKCDIESMKENMKKFINLYMFVRISKEKYSKGYIIITFFDKERYLINGEVFEVKDVKWDNEVNKAYIEC